MQGFIELGILFAKLAGVFGSGLYIAMSPCLFPLLPLFLLNSLKSADSRKRSVLVTAVLVLGILSSLAIFLSIAWIIGGLLIDYYIRIQAFLGLIIIFLGIVTMSTTLKNKLGMSSLNLKSQPEAPSNLFSVFLVGFGYSMLAAPCSGSVIFGVIALFGAETGILVPLLLFLALSIAVSIPYFAIAVVTGEARLRMAMSISNHARKVEIVAGLILILIGTILFAQLFGFRLYL
ncbi:MAG: cytochrome c biogenesis CcdA family protein [Candidatus Thorarchaeota archaeon]